jgi:hypothetical protein
MLGDHMITMEFLYVEYLKMKGIINNRPYRLPKNPDLSLEKLRQSNQANYDKIKTLSDYFNTKWQNIDPIKYLETGFKLFPKFTYTNFLNDKILKQYIQNDKIQKFHCEACKKQILKSFKFMKGILKKDQRNSILEYCKSKNEFSLNVVNDYIRGHIDPYTFLYLLLKKYIILSIDEKEKISDFLNNISKYRSYVKDEWELFTKMEKIVNESLLITDPPSGNLILGDKTLEEIEEEKKKFNKMKLLEE